MKKIVIIIISVLFIASIFVVNFLGMQMAIFETTKYVTKVECDTIVRSDGKEYHVAQIVDGVKYFIIDDFIGGDYTVEEGSVQNNPNTFRIDYRVYPDDADNKTPVFVYDKNAIKGACMMFDDIASVVLIKPNRGLSITIKSNDGSNKTEKIYIVAIQL